MTLLQKAEESIILAMSALGDTSQFLIAARDEQWADGCDGSIEQELLDEWYKAISALNLILDRMAPPPDEIFGYEDDSTDEDTRIYNEGLLSREAIGGLY